MKSKSSHTTTNQPPKATAHARSGSVRGALRSNTTITTVSTSAAANSQLIWPPMTALNMRPNPCCEASGLSCARADMGLWPACLPVIRSRPL
ncbi:Uncharacterised protein [Mycobacteroides abscessus subsp. abscessus]|nr:Uncharacterised protein [Mycobacteroides abscessus subsp. abscessus]